MNNDFGIYIHWPFCAAKCPYCDFNSHVRINGVDQPRFAQAFIREMQTIRERTGPRDVKSIFIGGGTPSLMEPKTLGTVLEGIAKYWSVPDDIEITMEANPSSVEADRFKGYRAAGINRLSLGVQSLDDGELKRLGRLHDVAQAKYAISLARDIFPRLSFDLIYARPDQTLESWQKELNEAIDLAADHLSLYQLTIEEGTAFHRLYEAGKLHLPEPEHAADLYDLTEDITTQRGLPNYEVSNYAIPGHESQHNLLYWRYQEYAGFGPGAHGRFIERGRFIENNQRNLTNTREANHIITNRTVTITEKMPERWLSLVEQNGHGIVEEEYLTQNEQADEMLLMGLRLHEGLDLTRYETLAGKGLSQQTLSHLQQQNLIEMMNNTHLRVTSKGRILLNHIITELAV